MKASKIKLYKNAIPVKQKRKHKCCLYKKKRKEKKNMLSAAWSYMCVRLLRVGQVQTLPSLELRVYVFTYRIIKCL